MDEWKKFNETSLPKKEYLNSNLNIEKFTDLDYYHAKRLFPCSRCPALAFGFSDRNGRKSGHPSEHRTANSPNSAKHNK